MRDRYTITIHNENSYKSYTIEHISKKRAIFGAILVLFLALVGIFWIFKAIFINNAQDKKISTIKRENSYLAKQLEHYKRLAEIKSLKIYDINAEILNLEKAMGKKSDISDDLCKRIEKLKLAIIRQKNFFKDIPNGSPVKYQSITSGFGWRKNPILKKREFHPGIDLKANKGTKVYATADGIVEYSGYKRGSGYGNYIVLDHNFGFQTMYAHLSKRTVKNGDFVKKGTLIGYVGNTGLSTGAHLHYGITYLKKVQNPYYFIKMDKNNFDIALKKIKSVKWSSVIEAIQSQVELSLKNI